MAGAGGGELGGVSPCARVWGLGSDQQSVWLWVSARHFLRSAGMGEEARHVGTGGDRTGRQASQAWDDGGAGGRTRRSLPRAPPVFTIINTNKTEKIHSASIEQKI